MSGTTPRPAPHNQAPPVPPRRPVVVREPIPGTNASFERLRTLLLLLADQVEVGQ
ncbi:hypothetical protein ACN20G_33590 (plasmid) [Streptomyces sp. BI20]|uniref:hypothetical protein n=1 Tax=Streptomyces sp. BI20 TaxID=3403460 RepID=UPI003C77D887